MIPRDRLPHTSRNEPHLIARLTGDAVELHVEQGKGTRPDNLILIQRGIATAAEACKQADATRFALMRTGLLTNVPMLFGKNESGSLLSASLVDRVREASGSTPRPGVHGIDIIDEADGPTTIFRFEAEGRAGTPIDKFLGELAASIERNWGACTAGEQLGLAVEVFMAATTERTPRTRFLDFVTVLEILAEHGPRSQAAIAIVDEALAQLERLRADLEENEASSLRSSLAQLRTRSIGQSIRDLAIGLDAAEIDGFHESGIDRFLGRATQYGRSLCTMASPQKRATSRRWQGACSSSSLTSSSVESMSSPASSTVGSLGPRHSSHTVADHDGPEVARP